MVFVSLIRVVQVSHDPGDVVVEITVDGVVVWIVGIVAIVTVVDPQLAEVSSPILARENLFFISTAALLDTPTIPAIKRS